MIRERWLAWGSRLGVLAVIGAVGGFGRALEPVPAVAVLVVAGLAGLWALERLRAWDVSRATLSERQRLAAELHDGVATRLAGLSWGVSGLRRAAQRGQATAERAAQLEQSTKELAQDLRRVVLELREHPRALGEWSQGLLGRLRELATAQADARGVPTEACRIHFALSGDRERSVAGGLCRELERIVIEGVYNALRHANCENIYVNILAEESIEIEVRDDGFGILGVTRDVRGPSPSGGLSNLQNRVEGLRGQLSVATGNRGTSVRLRVPLAA
ncbi:MAG: hypothetical protein KC766_19610 [Myxococcales bacterium]|nr:hypothetical protein [Myxococcales bacterium]